ncbi:universal stress protein [Halomicroarcula sp. GCM10025817]|uniref:universal stress protein n=1 Tax=Haloarcula TaxID=2237 RepID=UPI0023E7744C|nr:universal stress protein [Halomicroarcula sp. SYNS111]
MPDNVLVAFDGSQLSERALGYALETVPDANFTSIYVINPVDSVIDVEAGGLAVAHEWYDNAIDQIVLGSHGRSGLDRALLGSVAETVTRRAQIPVAVIA